jgi:DNA-binding transcriptional regulator YiaG
MKKKYQSEILKVLYEDALGLYKIGVIDEVQMREFDEECLVHDIPSGTPSPARHPVKAVRHSAGAHR